MSGTTGLNWNQVAAVCPNDGVTPCSGMLGGVNSDGWVWATQNQVMELFGETVPEIANTPSVGGSAYVRQGLSFFGGFKPTFESCTSSGTLSAGSTTTLAIAHGNPNGVAALAIGAAAWNAPFPGGTFVPTPDVVIALRVVTP